MHSLIAYFSPDMPEERKYSNQLWQLNNEQEAQSSYQGLLLLFGGIDENKVIKNDLWLIRPDSLINSSQVFDENGEIQSISDNSVYYQGKKANPSGLPPVPRYGHSVSIFKRGYMAIFGGRNDDLINKGIFSVLNDLHLYDISKIYSIKFKQRTTCG